MKLLSGMYKKILNKGKNRNKLGNKGFSLMEVLIAMVILAIVTLPILSSFSTAGKLNSNARKQENANAFAQKMIEEFKALSVLQLTNNNTESNVAAYSVNNSATGVAKCLISDIAGLQGNQRSYEFNMASFNAGGNPLEHNGNVYCEGPNGEKYFVKVTLDPEKYSDKAAAIPVGNDVTANNINSFDMPSFTDVVDSNNMVFQNQIFLNDAGIFDEFVRMGATTPIDKTRIRKEVKIETTIAETGTVSLKTSETDPTPRTVIIYSQTAVATVTYINEAAPVASSYYSRTYTFQMNASNIIDNASKINTVNSLTGSSAYKTFSNVYLFENPFDIFRTATSDYMANDRINVNYTYPTSITTSDFNTYVIEQESYNQNNSSCRAMLDSSKVKITVNGTVQNLSLGTLKIGGHLNIYSNIQGWTILKTGSGEKNGITQNFKDNPTKYLYGIKVEIWVGEMSGDPYLTVTSTKEN